VGLIFSRKLNSTSNIGQVNLIYLAVVLNKGYATWKNVIADKVIEGKLTLLTLTTLYPITSMNANAVK